MNDEAKNWSGVFFTPEIGETYKIPEDAAEYKSLRGRIGTCMDYAQAGSRAWATMRFPSEENPHEIVIVRTCYLVDMDGNQGRLIDDKKPDRTPQEMFAAVWKGESNSGTVSLGKL